MNELLLEFLKTILYEERVKGVRVSANGQRIVNFSSEENLLSKIKNSGEQGVTYRKYNPQTDSGLEGADDEPDSKPAAPAQSPVKAQKQKPAKQPKPQRATGANEVFGNILSAPIEINGVSVRQIIDPKTNQPIDVTTDSGRKTAIGVINEQLSSIDEKFKRVLKQVLNKENTGTNDFKWLGNVGELHTLKELLGAGIQSYLLPEGNADNDIVIIRPDENNQGIIIQEISVKSSTGEVAGGRGANARKSLRAAVKDKTMKVSGKDYKAEDVVDTAMLTYIQFTRFFSEGFFKGRNREIVVPAELDRANNQNFGKMFDTKKLDAAIELSKSSSPEERKGSQSLFLESRLISKQDLKEFSISLNELNTTPEHKKLINHFLKQLTKAFKASEKSGNPFTALDMRKLFTQQLATILKKTRSSLNFDTDLVSVQFNESGETTVRITPAETVRQRAAEKFNVKDVSQISVEDQMRLSKFSLRTRALGTYDRNTKQPRDGYLGAIINMAPLNVVKPSDKLKPEDYARHISNGNQNPDI